MDERERREFAYTGTSNPSPSTYDLEPVAEDIAIARGECVAEALFHMAAIRSLQSNTNTQAHANITCAGAMVQDRPATDGKQAAHLVPGQIKVHGQPVWALATTRDDSGLDPARAELVSLRTQMCFAKTNVLPAHFNRADSQAERMASEAGGGLKYSFGETVRSMWSTARVDPAQPLLVDRAAVLRALGGWFTTVNRVYSTAAQLKQAAAARASDAASKQRRHDEARVLFVYANSFKVAADPSRFVNRHLGWLDGMYRWR